jgi:hypothetical protein
VPARIRSLALLAAVVAGCGQAAGLAGCGGASPRWRALAPTALAPGAATVNVASILAPGGGWPWVVGGNTKTGDLPDVGLWHSADGRTWTRAQPKGLTLDAPHNLVFSVARRGIVGVAVGETPGQAHGNPRPTIWRSVDGSTWSEVPTLREDFGGPKLTDIRAVTAGPTGFAVVGNWMTDDGTPVIAVWLSSDGFQWVRFDHVASLTSRAGEELTAFSIASGPGGFVIAGEAYDPTPTQTAHVEGFLATSKDGKDWSRVAAAGAGLDNGSGQVAVRQVLAVGNSFVALGTRALGRRNEIDAWRPTAAGAWAVTTVAAAGFVSATSLAPAGDETVAAVIDDGVARLWASKPGGSWAPVAAPPVRGAANVLLGSAGSRMVLAVQIQGRATLWVR